jgi:hypothetical protein
VSARSYFWIWGLGNSVLVEERLQTRAEAERLVYRVPSSEIRLLTIIRVVVTRTHASKRRCRGKHSAPGSHHKGTSQFDRKLSSLLVALRETPSPISVIAARVPRLLGESVSSLRKGWHLNAPGPIFGDKSTPLQARR